MPGMYVTTAAIHVHAHKLNTLCVSFGLGRDFIPQHAFNKGLTHFEPQGIVWDVIEKSV
jgi:hypothetical protein